MPVSEDYTIYTGLVAKATTTTTTSIHSEGGEIHINDRSIRSTPTRIYSTNKTVWDIWLRGEHGDERHYQIADYTAPLREGQILSLLLRRDKIITIYNHNTGMKHTIPRGGGSCGCAILSSIIVFYTVGYSVNYIMSFLTGYFGPGQLESISSVVFWFLEVPTWIIAIAGVIYAYIRYERDFSNNERTFLLEVQSYKFKQ